MVVIIVEAYKNAKVHKITVKNQKLFWVKMSDLEKGLGMKNISDLLRKKCVLFLKLKILLKNKRKNI